jgi:AcrR family transcriptional regulator
MPRTKAANQQLRDVQRTNILDAARLIFSRKGPTATMDDIAEAANVSHGLAYRYFPHKEALFEALVDEALQAGPAGLRHFEQMSGKLEDRLTLLISRLIESRRERPEFYLLLDHVWSSPATPQKLRNKIGRQKEAFISLLRRLILEGQTTGKVHSGDPDQLVMAVEAFFEGLTRIALHEPEQLRKQCPEPEIVLRMLVRQDHRVRKKVNP